MIPVVVNTPETMVKVKVLTMKEDSENTLKALHKAGVLHIDTSEELSPVDRAAIEDQRREVTHLLDNVNTILSYLPDKEALIPAENVEVIYTRPLHELNGEVESLYTRLHSMYQRTVRPAEKIEELSGLKKYLEPLARQTGQTGLKLRDLKFTGDYLFSRVFVFRGESFRNVKDSLKDRPLETIVATAEDENVVYGIGKVKDLEDIESLVTGVEGKILQIPDEDYSLQEYIVQLSDRLSGLQQELSGLQDRLIEATSENINRLVLLREVLLSENERLAVLEKACEARYVILIQGWMPESSVESTISELKDTIDDIFIDTREAGPDEEPPTKMNNPAGFRPFHVIVNLFGTPRYREWDPTPILSYSFALFFGIMVCDVVYALGIMLLGRFLLAKFVDDPDSENFKLFQKLLYICSGVALIGGLLTGQYLGNIYTLFGFEDLALSQGVKELLQDPVSFIVLALGIGFIHVNIGHIMALIKGIKDKNRGVILGKVGLFAVQFGIPSILNSLLNVNIPGFTPQLYSILSYVMAGGVLVIIVSSVMQSGGLGAILWLFDITGLLGDVMSYARLAGVGLATFYLASTFNLMAELFSGMIPGVAGAIIGGILGVVIIIFGHTVNMVLTAITGFMHSLRLCFVEFLFKFYEGGGNEYSPFRLKKRAVIPLTIR
jgi:V/A-type H+-transporting ATPase subunit I